jgi:Protein of unknown function (DUF2735)
MTNNHQNGSAKIYAFPARGRIAIDRRRDEAAKTAMSHVVQTACGSAWYHEEAIAEAEQVTND